MIPTRSLCPPTWRIITLVSTSHSCTSEHMVPTAKCLPFSAHLTDVTTSGLNDDSSDTLLVSWFRMNTLSPKPTAIKFKELQSNSSGRNRPESAEHQEFGKVCWARPLYFVSAPPHRENFAKALARQSVSFHKPAPGRSCTGTTPFALAIAAALAHRQLKAYLETRASPHAATSCIPHYFPLPASWAPILILLHSLEAHSHHPASSNLFQDPMPRD
eukprot:CAMPEP_0178445710 /NCGR_PEP_ID=MMETSP0689_2-20121128/40340_1 /TAXON_ID=160604 /ORGANISM="Amphidinium massartii, Strain CS-259" /LENGTH=215 /DNA_ID=CAMNT_0020070335 /DNA_START=614 /DNA_END=1262 /DNA_ORIENTATION=-